MATTPKDQLAETGTSTDGHPERTKEVFRYYQLAKKQEWQVRDMAWGEVPPIPETTGSNEQQARRQGVWRSVITQ
ncbi:MAG TPA: hypothetical protein VFM83_05710, partial [Gaiellaceae bacterium]|nr:hypothetical protein [Gaiellaceae bacterium]